MYCFRVEAWVLNQDLFCHSVYASRKIKALSKLFAFITIKSPSMVDLGRPQTTGMTPGSDTNYWYLFQDHLTSHEERSLWNSRPNVWTRNMAPTFLRRSRKNGGFSALHLFSTEKMQGEYWGEKMQGKYWDSTDEQINSRWESRSADDCHRSRFT